MTAQQKIEYHQQAISTAEFHIEEAERKLDNKLKHFNESIAEHENAIVQVKQEELARMQLERTLEG
jgi:peptidoglycan hydrolase CwlO-like protein